MKLPGAARLHCRIVKNDTELAAALAVRRRVFVEEQAIDERLEYDGLDGEALHVIAVRGGEVVGTARLRFPASGVARVERMAVLKPCRRQGVGRALLEFLHRQARQRGAVRAVLHAQCAASGFYRACGYTERGPVFEEAGIPHVEMYRRLQGDRALRRRCPRG